MGAVNNNSFYIPISELFPGQSRFSKVNVDEKVNNICRDGSAVYHNKRREWTYKYNKNRSVFPKEESFAVVKAPFGYLLTDGHHHIMASLQVDAKRIPVHVISNMDKLSIDEFWAAAKERGWVHMKTLKGDEKLPPKKFTELVDDPNRYFAAETSGKITRTGKVTGASYPIWLKKGKDIPFIEFKIADRMLEHGLRYKYVKGENPPDELVEKVRALLVADPIEGLRLVSERTHKKNLNLDPKKI